MKTFRQEIQKFLHPSVGLSDIVNPRYLPEEKVVFIGSAKKHKGLLDTNYKISFD